MVLSISTLFMGAVVLVYVGYVTYKQLCALRSSGDNDTAPQKKHVLMKAGMVAALVLLMFALTVRF